MLCSLLLSNTMGKFDPILHISYCVIFFILLRYNIVTAKIS